MTVRTHKHLFALIERIPADGIAIITIKNIETREVLARYETFSAGAAKSADRALREMAA